MKLKVKKDKIRESYYFPPEIVERLEKLAIKLNYTRTDLVEKAILLLLEENE